MQQGDVDNSQWRETMQQHPGFRILALVAGSTLLGACVASGPVIKPPADSGPATTTSAGPAPEVLRAAIAQQPLPRLVSGADVAAFVDAAGLAPVARREALRHVIGDAHDNTDIANQLIAEFEAARTRDFSRALVVLALLGEQRNPAGTAFLNKFVWEPLPQGGPVLTELGLSAAAEAQERLQVKAVNAIPYARTPQALRLTLEIAARHPLKAVRIEAASSYLWNQGNSAVARRTLAAALRRDEQAVLDRPVRDAGMRAQDFNRQLADYLRRHPELQPPAPERSGPGKPEKSNDEATPSPPAESQSSGRRSIP